MQFKRSVSLRITIYRITRFANEQLIVTVIANRTLSNPRFNNKTSHSRKFSVHVHKNSGSILCNCTLLPVALFIIIIQKIKSEQ